MPPAPPVYREDLSALHVTEDLQPLFLSSRPGYLARWEEGRSSAESFIGAMRELGIRLAVVLLTDEEMRFFYGFDLCERYRRGGVEAVHFPVEDGTAPEDFRSFHRLVTAIQGRLKSHPVLAHCNAGLGRAGTVAAGLLVLQGAGPEAAISRVRKVRSRALENRFQEEFIHAYHRAVSGRGKK